MPRKAIDYSKTVIYRIVCLDPSINECYVGHTTDFTSRKRQHKSNCYNEKSKKYYNLKVYKFIRDNGEWENWCMLKICDYPCNNVYEAKNQERFYLEEFKATLNSSIPNQTHKEYNKIHKNEIKEYNQNYYQKQHKDNLEYSFVCDCCNYKTKFSNHLKQHNLTKKHLTNLEKI